MDADRPCHYLPADQQAALEQWARSRSLPARVVERARIVLLAAEGRQNKQIAAASKGEYEKTPEGIAD